MIWGSTKDDTEGHQRRPTSAPTARTEVEEAREIRVKRADEMQAVLLRDERHQVAHRAEEGGHVHTGQPHAQPAARRGGGEPEELCWVGLVLGVCVIGFEVGCHAYTHIRIGHPTTPAIINS